MSKVNKLTTSFIKITNALEKVKNQNEYNIYVSMLDEEELECLIRPAIAQVQQQTGGGDGDTNAVDRHRREQAGG
ncbi:MAG: hypothetical protein ACKPKO_15340 [Candidatus Fonsibacter sp.]